MPQLTTLASDTALDQVLEVLDRDGALILGDVRSPEQAAALTAELMPYIEATMPGQEDFAGRYVIKAFGAGINEWQVAETLTRAGDFDIFLLAGRYTLLEHKR